MKAKCDKIKDCDDKTDEYFCSHIRLEEDYNSRIIPQMPDGKKLNVRITFGVKEIVEINEPQVRKLVGFHYLVASNFSP